MTQKFNFNLSRLRDVGIICNDGQIPDYKELTLGQTNIVIKGILSALNMDGEDGDCNIETYLRSTESSGRTIYPTFPIFIIRDILIKYKIKLIDYANSHEQ